MIAIIAAVAGGTSITPTVAAPASTRTAAAVTTPTTTAPVPTATALALTRAERRFVADAWSQFSFDAGTSSDTVASLGDSLFSSRSTGSTRAETVNAVQAEMSSGAPAGAITRLAARDLCRKYLPKPPAPTVLIDFLK